MKSKKSKQSKTRFIGREPELQRLLNLNSKKTASFVVLKGRRRIGKSRLVDEFSKHFEHYYKFEGLAPDPATTKASQISEFCRQMAIQFKLPKAHYDDWGDVFWALGAYLQTKSKKTLLFFDELSWMGSKDPTLLGKIKYLWDNQLNKNPNLIFIVCSSASYWIEENLLSSTAFVGRISLTLRLEELPLEACKAFWPRNISAYEQFKVLSITGGIPRYLEEIDPKSSAEENIHKLCFMNGGFLVKEFNSIFSDLFKRESIFYKKIVNYLKEGPKEQTEIEKYLTKERDSKHLGRLPDYLEELLESGFIQRDYTWNLKTRLDSKLSRYRLKDNYLRFYLKYIDKNMSKIERGLFSFNSLSNLTEWNTVLGLQFENLVLNNREKIHQLLKIKSDEIISENPFFQKKTARNLGCQIDYMIQTKYDCLYICEIKFTKNKIETSIIEEVQTKINRLSKPKSLSCRSVLIHVNGVNDEVIESDFFCKIIDFSDLV
ncbi:MAG: AAA family ATPase [Gammaproteobacteria bacterium]